MVAITACFEGRPERPPPKLPTRSKEMYLDVSPHNHVRPVADSPPPSRMLTLGFFLELFTIVSFHASFLATLFGSFASVSNLLWEFLSLTVL